MKAGFNHGFPMLRILLFLLFLLPLSVRAETVAVPQSYQDCIKGGNFTEKTDLKCVFSVPADKSNSEKTKQYFACQTSKPNWQFLKSYQCEFADYENKSKPRFARCTHESIPTYFPPFTDDCRFVYYNYDYTFPTTLAECMAREEHLEDVTPELKQMCFINVTFAPDTKGEPFDAAAAHKFIEKCQIAGGNAEVVDKFYPECSLGFTAK